MKQKVGIIGKFGADGVWVDGQTIKTKNLAMLLEKTEQFSLVKADTCYFKRKNLKLLMDSLRCMFHCKHVFLMVSVNGMKFYLPFLHYLNKITHRKIYHYIIGSELLEMVKEDPKLVKYLNSLAANWFEYDSGTKYLRDQGVENVSTLPNFKVLVPVEKPIDYDQSSDIFRFCTFSRVMEEKGITEAIETVRAINDEQGRICVTLDIYGQIEPCYQLKLNELVLSNSDCVAYKGIVDSQSSVDVLKNYYALLFPTKWAGEGFPGTLVDAFAAGIPVIASDWNANKEIVHNDEQGIIYPNGEMLTLKDAINYSLTEKEKMADMRHKSRREFDRYTPNAILQAILEEMNQG